MAIHGLVQLGLILVLLSVIWHFVKREQRSRLASKLNCRPPPSVPKPWWDLLGIEIIKYTSKARNEHKAVPRISEIFERESRRLGRPVSTMMVNSIASDTILTFDPENMKAGLATQFADFEYGDDRVAVFGPLLGTGIVSDGHVWIRSLADDWQFTSTGAKWQHSRALLKPAFKKDQISETALQYQHTSNMMLALRPKEDSWTDEIDLQPLFFRLTMDASTEMLFGESVDSQLHELPQALRPAGYRTQRTRAERDFTAAFDKAEGGMAQKLILGGLHWTCKPAGHHEAVKECHAFIDYYVKLALKRPSGTRGKEQYPEKAAQGGQKYVFLDELADQTRDPEELRSQLINILLAGRDTTAGLLSFLFANLVRRPDVYLKLRTAILADFGTYNSGGEISFSGLKACTYLQHALAETLRLYPSLPINSRQANKDTTLPTGGGLDGKQRIFVAKGTPVRFSCALMHRDPQYWGEDCLEFKPERWAGKVSSWTYLPFSGGPRICLGQQFALTSAAFATVRLLQRFDQMLNTDPHDQEDLLQHMTLVASPAYGVKCRLHEAERL